MVPDSYVPNSLTSASAILNSGYHIVATNQIVNCPVVPYGSTAALTYGSTSPQSLVTGWYKDSTVVYFNFDEAKTPLTLTSANQVLRRLYMYFLQIIQILPWDLKLLQKHPNPQCYFG